MNMEVRAQIRELDVFAVTDKGEEELKHGSTDLSRAALGLRERPRANAPFGNESMVPNPGVAVLQIVIASLALGLAGLCAPVAAADAERGSVLYDARCNACHASSVHQRSARKAKSFDGVRVQVARWSNEVGGSWTGDEIDDVTLYLNQRYYRFPCPPSVCKANQASLAR